MEFLCCAHPWKSQGLGGGVEQEKGSFLHWLDVCVLVLGVFLQCISHWKFFCYMLCITDTTHLYMKHWQDKFLTKWSVRKRSFHHFVYVIWHTKHMHCRVESECIDYSTQYPWSFGILSAVMATGLHPLKDYPENFESGNKVKYRSHDYQALPDSEQVSVSTYTSSCNMQVHDTNLG